MPTNILRSRTPPPGRAGAEAKRRSLPVRHVLIRAGRVAIRAELLDTPTAHRIAEALPFYGVAETWGGTIHFEVPVETGRERGARLNAAPGDVAFWSEDDRVIIAFGPTPISREGEIRLPRPCNIWARALDDVSALKAVTPGEKVTVTAVAE